MEYVKSQLSDDLAKKILGNKKNALVYLMLLHKEKPIDNLNFRIPNRGKEKGQSVLDIDSSSIWKMVVDTWDYELGKKIIRDLFRETDKYKNGREANEVMDLLVKEWEGMKLGKIEWPFSQGDFDGFVQRINSEKSTGLIKDEKVKGSVYSKSQERVVQLT